MAARCLALVVLSFLGAAAFGAATFGGAADGTKPLLAAIRSIGKEGAGHAEAQKAWKELVARGPTVLPELLAAFDDASPLAANWLRSAHETIVAKAQAKGQKVDAAALETFLRDTRRNGQGRRLAYETLVQLDPTAADRLLPTFLNDPGIELRREAVEVLLRDAQKLFDAKDKAAAAAYRDALKHARERDQVQLISDRLKKLGDPVDLTRHFGFVTRWALVGPFENSKGVGFNAVYPPDRGVSLKEEMAVKGGAKAAWREHTTDAAMGVVDLNKVVGALKGAVAYGFAEIMSPQERPIEIRCGSNNAVRMSLNGKEVYFREEYHHGMVMDQHVGKGTLKAGRNTILIKVCQNEQTDSWAQLWSFQLRVCDHLGGAVPFEVVTEKLPAFQR